MVSSKVVQGTYASREHKCFNRQFRCCTRICACWGCLKLHTLLCNIAAGSTLLVVLAAVDAAFSGDWSRIGAISKDTELWLQSALGLLGIWHLLMGAAAYSIAEQHGRPKLLVTIKVTKLMCYCLWMACKNGLNPLSGPSCFVRSKLFVRNQIWLLTKA